MAKAKQLVLSVRSQPGVLAKVSRALADAGVNITGLSGEGGGGRGKLRLLVNNPAKARRALRAAGFRATDEPAFVVRMRNKPGALARVAERVAKARVNIKSVYATTAGRGSASVVMTVSSPPKARKILG